LPASPPKTDSRQGTRAGSPLATACYKTLEFETFVEHFVGHFIEIRAILDKVLDEVRDKVAQSEVWGKTLLTAGRRVTSGLLPLKKRP
jgi:hypothetical protein